MGRKTIRLLVFLLMAAMAAGAAKPGPLTLDVMVLPGTTGLSLVKVLADRPALGKDVTAGYTVIKSPDLMAAKVIAGEADIAALPTNTAAILYNKGIAVKIAAVTNWGVTYLVGKDGAASSWPDLKGRELGLSGRGATPDILLRYFLQANGVDPDRDVAVRYFSSPVELTQVMAAGKLDLAVLPEPWVTEALARDHRLRVLLDFQAEWMRIEKRSASYPQSCLVVQSSLAGEHPGIVREFLRQAGLSSAWVNSHPAEAGRLAEEYVQIPAAAAREAIPRCNLRFAEAGPVREEIDNYLRRLYLFDPASVGGKVPDAGFYWQE